MFVNADYLDIGSNDLGVNAIVLTIGKALAQTYAAVPAEPLPDCIADALRRLDELERRERAKPSLNT